MKYEVCGICPESLDNLTFIITLSMMQWMLQRYPYANKRIRFCNHTHAVRHYLISKGVDSDKILVLPNGVDTKRFQPIPEDEMLKSDLGLGSGPIVGYVGSFVKYEGLDILIDAFHKLSLKYEDARLLMVGDGVIRTSLENQVQSLGLQEKVVFTGRVPHDDVNKYHSLIDIAPFLGLLT